MAQQKIKKMLSAGAVAAVTAICCDGLIFSLNPCELQGLTEPRLV
jgi:hypothetical protein